MKEERKERILVVAAVMIHCLSIALAQTQAKRRVATIAEQAVNN